MPEDERKQQERRDGDMEQHETKAQLEEEKSLRELSKMKKRKGEE